MEKKQSLSSESDAQSAGRNVKRARPGARVRPRNHRHERNRNEIIKKRNEKKNDDINNRLCSVLDEPLRKK